MADREGKEKAIFLLEEAYAELEKVGEKEYFVSLAMSTGQKKHVSCFANFSDVCTFIEIEQSSYFPSGLALRFGNSYYFSSFFRRIGVILKMSWQILMAKRQEYQLELPSYEVTKLKDLLRKI